MITRAKFKNYKLLRDVEFPLGKLNVLVGTNGVGKSSVLEALHTLLQLASAESEYDEYPSGGRAGQFFRGPWASDQLVSKPDAGEFVLSVGGTDFDYALECTTARAPSPGRFKAVYREGDREFTTDFHQPAKTTRAFFAPIAKRRLASVVRLRLDASRLAEDHYSEAKTPRVEYDGGGLASVLSAMAGARDNSIEAVEHDLRQVVPQARRVRVQPARIVRREKIKVSIDGHESWSEQQREYTGWSTEIEWGSAGWIPARHLSEGTLLALGIITVIRHRPPALILLDDIDKALHPTAQKRLVDFLQQVVQKHENVQILATTHSPFIVDALDPGAVLVASSVDEGSTKIRRLSDHPAWGKQKDYLEPGEFWTAVGESWVAEPKQ